MEQDFYNNILLASFTIMYAYGICSLVANSPKGDEYDRYKVSRKIFGITMILWATGLVVQWFLDLRINNPVLVSALSILCYFMGAMLFEVAFSSLVCAKCLVRKRIKQVTVNMIFLIVILCANFFLTSSTTLLYTVYVIFTIQIVILTGRFLTTYRNAKKMADSYYSDKVTVFIEWLPNSIYAIIILGLAGPIVILCSNSIIFIYMLCRIVLFTYIFISYQNYMINIKAIKDMILIDCQESQIADNNQHIDITDIEANSKIAICLNTRIAEWVSNKGFTKKGLNIEDLAIEFNTNRTYISTFIHDTYKLSFREWITMLRIEYAKELLLNNEALTLNRVAELVGYSPNAFSSIFSKYEKTSPKKWRSELNVKAKPYG